MNKNLDPIITKTTIMIDESCQKIIQACKDGGIEKLKKAISEIAWIDIKRVDIRIMYYWLCKTVEQLNKGYLYKNALDEIISPSVWYQNYDPRERIVQKMCSELMLLEVNETDDKRGLLFALVDMSKV
jgi:hypothetical protein